MLNITNRFLNPDIIIMSKLLILSLNGDGKTSAERRMVWVIFLKKTAVWRRRITLRMQRKIERMPGLAGKKCSMLQGLQAAVGAVQPGLPGSSGVHIGLLKHLLEQGNALREPVSACAQTVRLVVAQATFHAVELLLDVAKNVFKRWGRGGL